MPCGGVLAASPLSLRAHAHAANGASPPALARAMAALVHHHQQHMGPQDDDDIFLENGLLSYENPNYHLDPARLDDALNRNAALALYGATPRTLLLPSKDGYDPDDFTDNRRRDSINGNPDLPLVSAKSDPQIVHEKEFGLQPGGEDVDGSSPACEKTLADLAATEKGQTDPLGDDDGDSRECVVQRAAVGPRDELYAVPVRRRPPRQQSPPEHNRQHLANSAKVEPILPLPPGWEKHEDNDGPYYWHIKSGTIQREAPAAGSATNLSECGREGPMTSSVTRSTTSSALDVECDDRKRREELAFKRRSYPARPEPDARAIRFFVRSLGWVEIAEEDLTPERSSRAVNKCIVDLSLGRNDLLDVVGRWGDGKDLFMDLDEGALKLMDPENLTTLHTQPIHTIRVWGVGRDNGRERDFAYVARDRLTRRHMCHVFRCDMPARTIANTLRDICKRIMIERSLQGPPARPTNLPTEQRRPKPMPAQSFPTPMEEPKKVLRAVYLGSTEVVNATGMEVLNDAIDLMSATVPRDMWKAVNVAVAPSMISILQQTDDTVVTECRVRYLSFLGIGRDVRRCAFIMHTAQDLFVAHIFHCEPSSGALCKTIEAACKLRYQKCLDAHPGGASAASRVGAPASGSRSLGSSSAVSGLSGLSGLSATSAGLGATLKSLVGSLTSRRAS